MLDFTCEETDIAGGVILLSPACSTAFVGCIPSPRRPLPGSSALSFGWFVVVWLSCKGLVVQDVTTQVRVNLVTAQTTNEAQALTLQGSDRLHEAFPSPHSRSMEVGRFHAHHHEAASVNGLDDPPSQAPKAPDIDTRGASVIKCW